MLTSNSAYIFNILHATAHPYRKYIFKHLYYFYINTFAYVRHSAEETEGDNYLDTSSEGSSGSEENHFKERGSSLGTTSHISQGGFVNVDHEVCPKPHLPVFQYFEKDPPYGREPLADKVRLIFFNVI